MQRVLLQGHCTKLLLVTAIAQSSGVGRTKQCRLQFPAEQQQRWNGPDRQRQDMYGTNGLATCQSRFSYCVCGFCTSLIVLQRLCFIFKTFALRPYCRWEVCDSEKFGVRSHVRTAVTAAASASAATFVRRWISCLFVDVMTLVVIFLLFAYFCDVVGHSARVPSMLPAMCIDGQLVTSLVGLVFWRDNTIR